MIIALSLIYNTDYDIDIIIILFINLINNSIHYLWL